MVYYISRLDFSLPFRRNGQKKLVRKGLTVLFVKLQAVRIIILFYVGASFRLKNRTRCEIRSLNHGQVSVTIRFLRRRVLVFFCSGQFHCCSRALNIYDYVK